MSLSGPLKTSDPYFGCTDINAQIINMRNQEVSAGRDARTHYYELVYMGTRGHVQRQLLHAWLCELPSGIGRPFRTGIRAGLYPVRGIMG